MNQETFNRIVDERCATIKRVLASKAKEYARGERLHNFKRAAGFMGKTPETACWGFAMKHFTSIADMIDDVEAGALPNEAVVDEKIGDAINYLILLEALLAERFSAGIVGYATGDSKRDFTAKVRFGEQPLKRRTR